MLVALPDGEVTAIGPEVAPVGTETTSCVASAEVTVADVPLNVTEFELGVELNPVPEMVTELPTAPEEGINSMIEVFPAFPRPMDKMLPTASYV